MTVAPIRPGPASPQYGPRNGGPAPVGTLPSAPPRPAREPYLRIEWVDDVTHARGFLVIDTLVQGMATGGTRMRAGCTLTEVEDLARGMSNKTAAFDLPIGGAKGGIDFDPKDPAAVGVLERFFAAMLPYLDRYWVTAEDLGMPQYLLDEVFERLGLGQSFHAAISRASDPEETRARVRAGLDAHAPGGPLGDVIGGYGVAQACLAAARVNGWDPGETTVAVQGVGTMGGAAAWYLHEAGMRVVAVADAAGTLADDHGLDVPGLLASRDRFCEIDRDLVPGSVRRLPREAVLGVECDILVPAAVSYAITAENVGSVAASVVVEAANAATTVDAELDLTARGVPVIPDFLANAGAVAWAWWLLLGYVGDHYEESFVRLRGEMDAKVSALLQMWDPASGPVRWAADVSVVERNPAPLVIP